MDIRKVQRDKAFSPLVKFVDGLMSQNARLRETLDTYSKEEEIAKLKQENYTLRMNVLHVLSEKEVEQAKTFRTEHYEKCKGNTRYILVGTGIGTDITVQCTKCNITKSITDVDNW